MGLSSKTVRTRGFSLIELLVAMAIGSLILLVVAFLYQTGLWEFRHSSGRIELVRRGRAALDKSQPYICAAVRPGGTSGPEAITFPITPSDDLHDAPASRLQFTTPIDFLGGAALPSARQLQANPVYYYYELAEVPGPAGQGNDLVLRRYVDELTPDLSVTPLVVARNLGVPDGAGGYRDGFVVRYLRPGAVELQVQVCSQLLTDRAERNRIESRTPMVIRMSSIIQIPYYSQQ